MNPIAPVRGAAPAHPPAPAALPANTALPVNTAVPGAAVPDVAVPDVAVPDVAVPGAAVPDVAVPDAAVPEDVVPGAAVLDLRGAAVRVGGSVLWSGVDLTVPAGEFVAVLGPNGVGKSTLLKVLLGLQPVAAGEVRVLGKRPGQASNRIGYLPQRRSFDPSLRVRGVDMVRLGLDGDRWGVPVPFGSRVRRRRAAAAVREVIDLVDAGGYAGRPIGECSGGEQQRLLIAQALVRQPDLLLLDEPLDSLDLPNQAAVAALISRICQHGVTVVIVAHDVNPILGHLDRVVYLASGGAASGTPAEVINGPTLSGLYGTPVEVLTASDGRLVVVGQPEAPAVHADRHTADRHTADRYGADRYGADRYGGAR